MNFIAKGLASKGLEVLAPKDKAPLGELKDFEKKREDREVTMKEALVAKFRFLKEDLLAPKRSKFEASSKTLMNDFLRRMIVENPEEVTHSYAEHFVRFNESTTKGDFVQFSDELGVMRRNVVRILGFIKKTPSAASDIQSMDLFLVRLDEMIEAANRFAAMSDEDRKKVLSGGKDGLNVHQRAALDAKKKVEVLKNKVYTKAQTKESKMKQKDSTIMIVLDKILAGEVAEEKRGNKGGSGGKVAKFQKPKSAGDKHKKPGHVKIAPDSIIEELSEAA